MTYHDCTPIRNTSITIRIATRQLLRAGSVQLKIRGVGFSEQRLLRECLRLALRFWRGRKGKAQRCRRYNKRIGPYEIMPFYTTEALRAVAWARCHHAGISLSRLADFAVRVYLPRVLEYWQGVAGRPEIRPEALDGHRLYAARLHTADFIISYQVQTLKNDEIVLEYAEKTKILPWPPPHLLAS